MTFTLFGIDILTGMSNIAFVYLGFAIVYLFNMIGGVIINCQIEKTETFSFPKLLISIEKVLFCALVLGGLVIATNLASQGLFEIDESIANMVTSVVSIGVFALVFAKGFIQKVTNLMDKIKYLLEIADASKQVDLNQINEQTLDSLHFTPELEPTEEIKSEE